MGCEGCTLKLCVVRGKALSKAMLTTCQRGNGAAVDSMLQKVEQARAAVATKQPDRHLRKAVGTASRKPCQSCNSKPKSKIARTVDRIVSLKNAAVDFIQDGMAVATLEQQAKRSAICAACPLNNNGWCDDSKGGCGCNLSLKVKPRSSSCPLGKWSAYRDEYRPLVNPARSLMFHLYPLRGKEWNWHWHIEQIRKHQDKFNGRIVIGVGVDKNTATMEEVQALFDGIRVDHWLRADNNKLAETLTHVEMLSLLQTDDPNAIMFRYHTKGVTKTRDAVEQKWAEIMWDGNMDLPSVEDALASHLVCGVMRSQTPLVKKKPGDFFYAGSAYWMQAKEVFERDWQWKEANRWIVEYVPAHLFSFAESACIFHDLVPSSVLNHQYFAEHVDAEWTAWKAARGLE
jgi:hypothetical protein